MNHFAVHLKLTQHCTPTILQLERKMTGGETSMGINDAGGKGHAQDHSASSTETQESKAAMIWKQYCLCSHVSIAMVNGFIINSKTTGHHSILFIWEKESVSLWRTQSLLNQLPWWAPGNTGCQVVISLWVCFFFLTRTYSTLLEKNKQTKKKDKRKEGRRWEKRKC